MGSIPERFVGQQGRDLAHPGVAPLKMNGREPVYHKYYQWVCFVLFFQAGLFYVPRYIWKAVEGGRVNMLAADMYGLSLVIVLGQMYFMDRFLGGEFSTYGLKVLHYTELDPKERADPMAVVFPKVSKCTFHKYGVSGTIEKHDALCVLPLNIINEKIYIFLWFW